MSRSHLLDIYDCWLHLATNNRELAAIRRKHKQIPKREPGNFGSTYCFRESPDTGGDVNHYLVHIDLSLHRGDAGELLNTVTHEATHVATTILDSVGQPYDGDSEALAWLLAWVARWIWDGLP